MCFWDCCCRCWLRFVSCSRQTCVVPLVSCLESRHSLFVEGSLCCVRRNCVLPLSLLFAFWLALCPAFVSSVCPPRSVYSLLALAVSRRVKHLDNTRLMHGVSLVLAGLCCLSMTPLAVPAELSCAVLAVLPSRAPCVPPPVPQFLEKSVSTVLAHSPVLYDEDLTPTQRRACATADSFWELEKVKRQ